MNKILKSKIYSKSELEKKLNIKFGLRNIVLTYHPETIEENKSFDLFFLDPPYKDKIINKSLKLLFNKKWIVNGSIGVIESKKDQKIEELEFTTLVKRKKVGISSFSFIRII